MAHGPRRWANTNPRLEVRRGLPCARVGPTLEPDSVVSDADQRPAERIASRFRSIAAGASSAVDCDSGCRCSFRCLAMVMLAASAAMATRLTPKVRMATSRGGGAEVKVVPSDSQYRQVLCRPLGGDSTPLVTPQIRMHPAFHPLRTTLRGGVGDVASPQHEESTGGHVAAVPRWSYAVSASRTRRER
jgi:hypothetical protein